MQFLQTVHKQPVPLYPANQLHHLNDLFTDEWILFFWQEGTGNWIQALKQDKHETYGEHINLAWINNLWYEFAQSFCESRVFNLQKNKPQLEDVLPFFFFFFAMTKHPGKDNFREEWFILAYKIWMKTVCQSRKARWQERGAECHTPSALWKQSVNRKGPQHLLPVTYFLQQGFTSQRSHDLAKQCHQLGIKCSDT